MVEPGAEAAAYINPVPGGLVLHRDRGGGEHHGALLALTHRLYQKYHSVNLDVILMLARRGRKKSDKNNPTQKR